MRCQRHLQVRKAAYYACRGWIAASLGLSALIIQVFESRGSTTELLRSRGFERLDPLAPKSPIQYWGIGGIGRDRWAPSPYRSIVSFRPYKCGKAYTIPAREVTVTSGRGFRVPSSSWMIRHENFSTLCFLCERLSGIWCKRVGGQKGAVSPHTPPGLPG